MAALADPQFRLDNESLAFCFTATLTDRYGVPVERLTRPESLVLWWELNGLALENTSLDESDLAQALELRETIHRLGTCVAQRAAVDAADVELLNDYSRCGAADLVLDDGQARWEIATDEANRAAMSVVAHDAVAVIGGDRADRIRTCERSECRGLFVDTSRAGNRRWCSMNTCGNREKKAHMLRADRRRLKAP